MAWTYLTRIFVSSSTCWRVGVRRTRASRSVLPISNTVDGLLLGRSGPVARRPNVQSSKRALRRQIRRDGGAAPVRPPRRPGRPPREAPPARLRRPRARGWPAARPVSYTHLRAHETDSYLVCRL